MYGGYLFIITLFMNTIFCFIESDVWFYNNEIFTYHFCTKYMWISFIISIILPYISKCFRGAFSINVEIKKIEKEKIKDEKKEVEVKDVNNEKIALVGFGTYEAKAKPARTCTNPMTGAKVKVDACTVPTFKFGKAFKDSLN